MIVKFIISEKKKNPLLLMRFFFPAKNVMLMGARSVTICDKGTVEWADLSAQVR